MTEISDYQEVRQCRLRYPALVLEGILKFQLRIQDFKFQSYLRISQPDVQVSYSNTTKIAGPMFSNPTWFNIPHFTGHFTQELHISRSVWNTMFIFVQLSDGTKARQDINLGASLEIICLFYDRNAAPLDFLFLLCSSDGCRDCTFVLVFSRMHQEISVSLFGL